MKKTNSRRKCITILLVFPFLISCNGNKTSGVKSLDEATLQLENFDFGTPLSTLLPERNKSKEHDGYYQVKSEMLEVDTISDGAFIGSDKPVRIEYRQRSFSRKDIIADFDDFEFNAINFATTLDGQIMLINALVAKTDSEQSKNFLETLNKKHGMPAKTKGEFAGQNFDIYTWQLKDRVIRYSMVFDNEENTLKIEADEDNKR